MRTFDRYSFGLDVLGQETNRALVVRILNSDELARNKSGFAAAFQTFAPGTTEAMVYKEAAKELVAKLKENGVRAEVKVADVPTTGWRPPGSAHIWQDALRVLGLVGVSALAWRLIGGSK